MELDLQLTRDGACVVLHDDTLLRLWGLPRRTRELDLDDSYGAHVDRVPAATLAPVNLMSLLGLHRALRGALVGHFAAVEITSSRWSSTA